MNFKSDSANRKTLHELGNWMRANITTPIDVACLYSSSSMLCLEYQIKKLTDFTCSWHMTKRSLVFLHPIHQVLHLMERTISTSFLTITLFTFLYSIDLKYRLSSVPLYLYQFFINKLSNQNSESYIALSTTLK